MIEQIQTPQAPQAIGPYSQAIKTAGTFLFLSGQIPLKPDGSLITGGVAEQTRQVIQNIQAVLEAAGYGLENIVKTTVFVKDMNDYATVNEVYGEFFGAVKPARSAVEVARLPKDVLVEIESIAVK